MSKINDPSPESPCGRRADARSAGLYSRDPAEYRETIGALTDDALVTEVEKQVWFSAFASNNPKAPAHWRVDACYTEAGAREKPWLYQRGWNQAYRTCGYEPSEDEINRALGPTSPNEPAMPHGKHPAARHAADACGGHQFGRRSRNRVQPTRADADLLSGA